MFSVLCLKVVKNFLSLKKKTKLKETKIFLLKTNKIWMRKQDKRKKNSYVIQITFNFKN